MYAFGSDILAPNGNGYRFNSSPVEETVAFLDDLRDSGCAWEPAGPYTETEFAERKAIFVSAPLSNHPYQNSELERAGNADAWSVIPFPSPDQRPAITVYGPELGMFEASSLEELAGWLLIKWLASPEQGARILLAGNGLPLRASTLEALGDYPAENPQWKQGLDLLDSANPEPNLPSWSVVRWVVSDVGTQIFRYYFTLDRTSATLELMDETAAELNARFENETGP
jgi:ABC-type glycerol-3-phosphate transport system substrate-binding protein